MSLLSGEEQCMSRETSSDLPLPKKGLTFWRGKTASLRLFLYIFSKQNTSPETDLARKPPNMCSTLFVPYTKHIFNKKITSHVTSPTSISSSESSKVRGVKRGRRENALTRIQSCSNFPVHRAKNHFCP